MNPKIEAIINQAPDKIKALLTEGAGDIEEAMIAAAKEAQLQETEAKLTIGCAIKVNLDKGSVEYAVSWSVRHTLSESVTLPDPNQPDLPGTTVTISGDGIEPLTVTGEQLRRAGDALRRRNKEREE